LFALILGGKILGIVVVLAAMFGFNSFFGSAASAQTGAVQRHAANDVAGRFRRPPEAPASRLGRGVRPARPSTVRTG
jgi:hypothetical protein